MMNQNIAGNPSLRMAVHAALTGGTLAASLGVAGAQEAPAPASGGELEEVVVTGSRIAVPNQTSISPVTFVSSADIATTGATRVEDVLNQLPQVFADQSSTVSNGATGTATVNLRGLNAKRTLVLVNGLRLGPGDPTGITGAASDINMIPAEMIESVEILTGGASSTYGADAVAGVVNFKLNDHFEGVKLVADAAIYSHGNRDTEGVEEAIAAAGDPEAPSHVNTGAQKSLAFIAGLNSADGNGNATFYATYRNVAAVVQSKYSTSACTLGSGFVSGYYDTGGKFYCGGSSTSYPGQFVDLATGGASDTVTAKGTLVPYTPADDYNYGALNYFQRPDERYAAGTFLHYAFNEHANVYSQSMFMNDRSVAQIAPSGAFFGTTAYTVNCANPYLSASELAAWCGSSTAGTVTLDIGRRNVEGGPRQDDLEHTDFREVIGVKGKLTDGWDYDASFQYGLVNYAETYYNDVSSTKINYALDVITDPSTGQPECAVTATGVTAGLGVGCVPWNIFSSGGVTKAATDYLDTLGMTRGRATQTVVNVNLTGNLGQYGVQIPTADSGLKVNFGVEYRDVTTFTTYDQEFTSGDLAGQAGAKTNLAGGIVSREGFVEARLPIMDDKPFARALNLETGYRYSDYSTGFTTNTFKMGLDWAPIDDVRLRVSFSRASRAPNIAELFNTTSVGLDGATDPCAGLNVTYSEAQCARTGLTATEYKNHILANTANQYNGLTGGNRNLQPETAITKSIGLGLTPTFLPNFRAQIDYYDITIENVVQTIGADAILKYCLGRGLFCNDIHRDASGSLWLSNDGYVIDALANVGQLEERGIDLDLSYTFDLGAHGKLRTNLVGTYLDKYEVTPVAADTTTAYNCAGYYGNVCSSTTAGAGVPVFRWRNTLRTTWSTPWDGLDITVSWRYYSAVQVEGLSPNPNLNAGGTVADGTISNTDGHLASYNYVDLAASIQLAKQVSLRVGCDNLLDKNPPVIGSADATTASQSNGNTYPGVYDSLGRFIFGQVTVQF